MSQLLIQQYLNQLQDLRKVSGSNRETIIREAFKDLLKAWGKARDLIFVPEYPFKTPTNENRAVDGALLYYLRMPFGYWEAKDSNDDLDAEIEKKLRRGYPQDNIIFEDSREAVLIQNRREVMRCAVDDVAELGKLLGLFFGYERIEIVEFHKAVEQFKQDLPAVLGALRDMIESAFNANAAFRAEAERFLTHAQETINPNVTAADVREMLIQHVLTEEIFSKVFGEDDFHRQNNVAQKLYALEATFFTGDLKKRTLRGLDPYYQAIRGAASQISSHQEKQTFLKVIYENFYKVYNKKAADRLGVVYTPNEIVRFMIESADWLCEKHFGRNLIDKNVEILDPATGTGTFITELMEHFRGQLGKLKYKYLEELHANEVAILPYYVANLNIEATYAAISGEYMEFPSLCFVDTLDNVSNQHLPGGLTTSHSLFGSVSEENVLRITRQNRKTISVIIGNPPYNANQLNENENNKNRTYPDVDKRIKNTYIAASTAQKTKLYDMYARFFRWASDRLSENGILAFISNRSFIESRTFDGFRKIVTQEFNEIYVIDLGGDVRVNPQLSGTKHNVFGIQTGVAISFLVKRATRQGATRQDCRIFYTRRPEFETAEEKLAFLGSTDASGLEFEEIRADARQNWINLTHNDFDSFIPVAAKVAKLATTPAREKAIFKLYSLGIVTARDEWVYDNAIGTLEAKVKEFVRLYEADRLRWARGKKTGETKDFVERGIKWTSELETHMRRGTKLLFEKDRMRKVMYRPFVENLNYYTDVITHRVYQNNSIFPVLGPWSNEIIAINVGNKSFNALATNRLVDYHFNGDSICLPVVRYEDSTRVENVTDWALNKFRERYESDPTTSRDPIDKKAIFHYVYGVLHDPLYRDKYALNLKRELPRIPLYADFWQWASWGKTLMGLHIGYEAVEPWPLKRLDIAMDRGEPVRVGRSKSLLVEVDAHRASAKSKVDAPKAVLKADKDDGRLILDTQTTLAGVPPEAWNYKLGNRSALEWVLDQYKERKPTDPTIREKFDTYRFADYKETVIDLLMRVTTVSVETQKIIVAMRMAPR